MKILTDHCVFGKTEVEDEEVLKITTSINSILVTNDKGFGNILKYSPKQYEGIIVLRISSKNQTRVHEILLSILKKYNHMQLKKTMVVIDSKTYRIRR